MEVMTCSPPKSCRLLDDILAIPCAEVSVIVRMHLRRSIKSHVTLMSTLRLEVALTSEFFGNENYLEADCKLMGLFIKLDQNISADLLLDKINECETVFSLKSQTGHPSHYNIIAPDEVGAFHLLIFANQKDPCEYHQKKRLIILPLLTDCFNVVSKGHPAMTQFIPSLLSCFRIIDGIIVEEEYGKTMGSHVYDCSIAILRFFVLSNTVEGMSGSQLCSSSTDTSDNTSVAVELGAGCGLVSIWLAKRRKFHRMIASDIDIQLPLIIRNIKLNCAEPVCTSKELNWPLTTDCDRKAFESSQICCRLQRQYLNMRDNEYLGMIIAGDVLYSKPLAEDFISVLRALATPNVTVIYLAQKLRNVDRKDTYDISSTLGLRCESIWEEADVVIWKIFVID